MRRVVNHKGNSEPVGIEPYRPLQRLRLFFGVKQEDNGKVGAENVI